MANALRNHIIGWAFELRGWSVRAGRRFASRGRPHLGGLDHVTIPVKDLAIARTFYCDVLGAAYLMTVDDETFRRFGRPPAENHGDGAYHISVYMGGTTRLDLFLQSAGQPAPTAGHPHFAFKVSPGGMRAWRRILEAKAIPFDGPLQLGPPGQASLYFNDPFGNHLEITCFGYDEAIPIRPPAMAKLAGSSGLAG
ncbi:MAG TPA: VOC family protein [Caulobacteraceae bacterium]|jgi:catechol 2,3-dioxygenase-like lactoylglutathione lyase family enzyme|nr:VOC family protein [Caulobacteraceae bacterium]